MVANVMAMGRAEIDIAQIDARHRAGRCRRRMSSGTLMRPIAGVARIENKPLAA